MVCSEQRPESLGDEVAPNGTPRRLVKLVNRLAQMQTGQVYQIIVFLLDTGEPVYTLKELGKVENYRRPD